jgi:hypothetical protein
MADTAAKGDEGLKECPPAKDLGHVKLLYCGFISGLVQAGTLIKTLTTIHQMKDCGPGELSLCLHKDYSAFPAIVCSPI